MTMQIVMPTLEGSIVLASDTKIRRTEKELTEKTDLPFGIIHGSKVRFSSRHDVAVALSGWDAEEGDLSHELADYIGAQETLPDSLVQFARNWGDEIFRTKFPGQRHDFPMCTLLVVNPQGRYRRFLKLRVRRESDFLDSSSYLINGNENNSAIFWPEYFKCDKELHDLQTTTRIAAFTILMGSEINDYGVGGLEIWRYDSEWKAVPPAEIAQLRTNPCAGMTEHLLA